MAKNFLLLCNGMSGSGKTTFINAMIGDAAYNLKSMTTRAIRDNETWGEKYYFVAEDVFDATPRATTLFVNQNFIRPGQQKWLYGVPEFEIQNHLGQNLVYDVIQPCYSRQLMDYFTKNGLDKYYDCRVLWFLPPSDAMATVQKRANMPDDGNVRAANTCNAIDFLRADVQPDFMLKYSREETILPSALYDLMSDVVAAPKAQIKTPRRHFLETFAEIAAEDARANVDYRHLTKLYFLSQYSR